MSSTYQRYFDAMPCYLTVQDHDLRVVEANSRFRRDFGDFAGRYCYQVYKHRSEKCEICPVEQTFRDGQSHSSEELVRTLDGADVSVIVYTTPIRDDTGAIVAVEEMSTDVTELKALQKQLRESQHRYRQLFEEVPCYISIQDGDLKILEANRRFREDFGNCLGCHCYKGYKHRDEECDPCPVQQTFDDGAVHHSEEVVRGKDGQARNVLVYATPIVDENGRIRSVMEMSTDITPIRQLQSQLESIGLLISSISHGIKGLLTGLDGGMYLVNTGLAKDDGARVKQGWTMVQRNVERIRGMVLNILYYAKEREPRRERLAIESLVDEVAGLLEPRAREHGTALVREIDPGAGELDADPQALRALLVNLVENSLDACRVDRKSTSHEVRLRAWGDAGGVGLSVSDNGIGMDEEARAKAFSLFFSSKGAEGTGLGLFIADRIARAHGGRIELESQPGRGSSFTIRLPRTAPLQDARSI